MAVVIAFVPALGGSVVASANTYRVHDVAELRAAVASAGSSSQASTIELAAGSYLPTSTLSLSGEVTLEGPSSGRGAKLDGGAVEPYPADLLAVGRGARVTLSNVSVSTGGGRGSGAAIDDYGTLALATSTLAGNNGPGLLVEPRATATVRNSTISEGLDFGVVAFGKASLLNTTIAGNAEGGVEDTGIVNLTNTIVARNGPHDCTRAVALSDHSLDGDGSCGVGALSHTDPLLGPLSNNGGPTETQALGAASAARAAGDASKCPPEDERHFARPPGTCDLGAYQTGATATSPTSRNPSGAVPGGAAPGDVLVGVRGHGMIRGAHRSRIAFSVRALIGQRHSAFTYTDGARHVALDALSLRSLAIDGRDGAATLRGTVLVRRLRRRIGATIVLVSRARRRVLRIRLANGYHAGGGLAGGSITFIRGTR